MPIRRVDEQQIRLAGLQPSLEQPLPELPRRHLAQRLAGVRAAQRERLVVAHGVHELVGDADAVMQVQALAVEVARRLADLDELLDLGMVHVDVDGRRPAPQRALRDRERQGVHDADERNDSRRMAAAANGLADRAHAAPIGADAAAVAGEPDVLGPRVDDAAEIVLDGVQEARDRQAAVGAAVAQDRRRRHEPELRHVVVEALRMRRVVGVGARNAREQVLRTLARQEIAIGERRAPERRQQRVARRIDLEWSVNDMSCLRRHLLPSEGLHEGRRAGVGQRMREQPCRDAPAQHTPAVSTCALRQVSWLAARLELRPVFPRLGPQ